MELSPDEAVVLVRLIGRAIRWVPEFDDIDTLTGYTLDEVMQFYIDHKRALGVLGVSDEDLGRSSLTSALNQYPGLPRFKASTRD